MSTLIFKSVSIYNFKAFRGQHSFVLDREAGLYYISGVNKLEPELGANAVGKSTIWDAVNWCLWGHTIRDARPADSIVPWDVDKQMTNVVLEFMRHNKKHWLDRKRKPNRLEHIDSHHCRRDIAQEAIADLIGMSEETFRRSIILGQFGTMFLDLKPEAQSQMFTEALDLDLWLDASAQAVQRRKEYERLAEDERRTIARNEGQLHEVAISVEAEEKRAGEFEDDKRRELKRLDKLLAEHQRDLEQLFSAKGTLVTAAKRSSRGR